jgi:hypothetical protein
MNLLTKLKKELKLNLLLPKQRCQLHSIEINNISRVPLREEEIAQKNQLVYSEK